MNTRINTNKNALFAMFTHGIRLILLEDPSNWSVIILIVYFLQQNS